MIIAFCGHSKFLKSEEYKQKILDFLEKTVGQNCADMYLGGYGAFDEFAYECCKEYKKNHSNISLIFITPYITVNYQKNYLENYKKKYDEIIYPEIENRPLKFAISYRNKWMVEKADYIICGINHNWGGAYQAYSYAKKLGKVILNVEGKIYNK